MQTISITLTPGHRNEFIDCQKAKSTSWFYILWMWRHSGTVDWRWLIQPTYCKNASGISSKIQNTPITGHSLQCRMNWQLLSMLFWENGSHHYNATHLSGYMTGIGSSRLCITPSTRLNNLCWTASDTTIQTDQTCTYHQLISFLLLFFASQFLSNQLSHCPYSLPTLREMKPPFLWLPM